MKRIVRAATYGCVACIMTTLSGPARAETDVEWLAQRQAQYSAWQTSHPNVEAAIADLKAKTAAMIARSGPRDPSPTAPPMSWRVPGAIDEIWDGPAFPRMVVIPAGQYTMGSPLSEHERQEDETQHRVTIAYPFAIGRFEVTWSEFRHFVAETGYRTGVDCYSVGTDGKELFGRYNWEHAGIPQTDRDPAMCLIWDDAKAYVAWLARESGRSYRLLSEAEWEYAARAGTTTARQWGQTDAGQCGYANGTDQTSKWVFPIWHAPACADGFVFTAPVGSLRPNAFGLYDMAGNVWEWMEDCWYDSNDGNPSDGSARRRANCGTRLLRGGGWDDDVEYFRSSDRLPSPPAARVSNSGLRVARTL